VVPDQTFAELTAELEQLRLKIARLEEDASRHQRVLEAWRDLWAQYEAIIEAFEGYIYICSSDYEVEFMNQRFIERTGYYPLGQKCHQVIHGLDHVCPWCVNERVFRGETVRWEVQSPKDGRWFYVVNTPIRHPDGSVSKMAMIQDITDRKEMARAVKETEEKYRDIFDNAVEGIFQSTPDGRLLSVNAALARMHGFASPAEMLTATVVIDRQIFVDPARRADLRREMEKSGLVRDFEVEVYRQDRSKFWIRLNGRAVRDETGAISYYEGFIQEIPAPRLKAGRKKKPADA
jgi:PAS domain S-box-containing protein